MIDIVKKTKLTELENKIPDVSSLATKSALIAMENNTTNVNSLATKLNQLWWKIKYLMLLGQFKKQTITQKSVSLKNRYWS